MILGVAKNSRFYIGDTQVRVLETEGFSKIVLEVKRQRYEITDQASVEIYPKVFVSVGTPKRQPESEEGIQLLPRLVIEAPKEIVILRSELYRKGKARSDENGR